ncbi:MAG: propionyl-CoA carboxylase [Desulfobacteraceae bacterium 4484_190.1]|nr:MAG: propionyl-CoA carboxylase [Desulfobacteraceae bacterium 4484_190.1]
MIMPDRSKKREYEENRKHWLAEEEKIYDLWEKAYNPGGQKQIDRLAKQGKKPVRQLIKQLIDPGTEFLELSRGAGFGINYEIAKDVPCAGLVSGLGKIHGNRVMIIANDSRVKAGAYYPINCKKHLRAQDIADQCGIPCVYIADSAGGFLPMQDRVFPGRGQFGHFFYNMSRMSAKGLKQYTLSTGGNTAGGAYIVYLACESIMIDKMSYSFLGGPPMVKAAIGEEVTMEELGGARVHTSISGGADHIVSSQDEGIDKLRELLSYDPKQKLHIERREPKEPRVPIDHLYEVLPRDPYRGIDVREVIACIADDSKFSEYKRTYNPGRGDTIVCGRIHLKGIPVGLVASNNIGVIFADAARKVPKIQWVIGPDHGAANYGMCGRAYDPHFIFNTMRGRTSVMSGRTAAFILTKLERVNAKKRGEEMDEKEVKKFEQMMVEKYSNEAHPFYLEARLFHDGTIPFKSARDILAEAFEMSLLKPIAESTFGNFKF